MKNLETKTKFRPILKAAVVGGVAFAVFSGAVFFSVGSSSFFGQELSDFYIFIVAPETILIGTLDPTESEFRFWSYCVIINSLLGALAGAFLAVFWLAIREDMRRER
jgi:hypothetical protein